MSRSHTILGAGGIIGRTLDAALKTAGITARRVDRTAGADGFHAADLLDATAARDAVAGAQVVHFAVGLPFDDRIWAEQFPPIMANVIAATRAAGARLVFMDNVYAYGPVAGVQTEDTPLRATTRKGAARADMIRQLEASDIDWVIARAADFYGPGANTTGTLNAFVLANAKAGKAPAWLGTVDAPHSFTYTHDIAAAMVTLSQAEGVSRTAWHVPTAPAQSLRALYAIAVRQLGVEAQAFQVLDLATVQEYGKGDAAMHATAEMFYQFDRDYVVSSARFEAKFGANPTSFEDGIRAALAHLP